MPMTTDRMQRLFDDLRKAAEQADCFDEVALREGLLACRARGASADAWYQVASTGDRLVVRLVTPDRWLSDFENLPIKPEVRPLILKENAARLFGLGSTVDEKG